MLKNMNNVKKYNLIENTNISFQKGLYSKKEYNSCIKIIYFVNFLILIYLLFKVLIKRKEYLF
jgi:hypothetical protein